MITLTLTPEQWEALSLVLIGAELEDLHQARRFADMAPTGDPAGDTRVEQLRDERLTRAATTRALWVALDAQASATPEPSTAG